MKLLGGFRWELNLFDEDEVDPESELSSRETCSRLDDAGSFFDEPAGRLGDLTPLQRRELREAHALIQSVRHAHGGSPSIFALAESGSCRYELSMTWESSHVALVTQKIEAVPLSMLECVALAREPDLIPLPRWPGLPRIEHIANVHEFAPNNVVYHVAIEPWGPFPGYDSVCCAVGVVRSDVGGDGTGKACVGFARSPPEDEEEPREEHRGWRVLPRLPRRVRMHVDGFAWVVAPSSAVEGHIDITTFMKTNIAVPHWLIPPSLVRWVTPKVFRGLLSLLTEQNKAPFRARVAADERGFYSALKRQLGQTLCRYHTPDGLKMTACR